MRGQVRGSVVDLRAFRPFEYDPAKVELAKATSPPFDVIDAVRVKALKKASPYNVTHLTLSQGSRKSAKGAKSASASALTKVEEVFESWVAEGALRQGKEECVYAYEVHYAQEGQERRMRGVLALVRLDPEYKQILPHERIFEAPVEERLALLRATALDLEPLQFLYPGKSVEATLWAYIDGSGRAPDLVASGLEDSKHALWRVTDAAVVGQIIEAFKGRKAYIADGHHRYAAAVAYSAERRSSEYRPPRNAPYDYKMAVLVNMQDEGLEILPTHRVVLKSKIKGGEAILKAAGREFEVSRIEGDETVAQRIEKILAPGGPPTFALYLGARPGLFALRSRNAILSETQAPDQSYTWRTLEVAQLQHLIVGGVFEVPMEKWGEDVSYTQSVAEAMEAVDAKKAVAAVFHRPVTVQQLRAVADSGEVMPQKSTFFIPKMVSGAAFYRIGKEPAGPPMRKPSS
jgi:uncharacterized protein (DUF1015 family)